jgi:hypothetical protein
MARRWPRDCLCRARSHVDERDDQFLDGDARRRRAQALFPIDVEAAPGPIYDVTADGSRFIVGARVQSRVPPSIMVLHNWREAV